MASEVPGTSGQHFDTNGIQSDNSYGNKGLRNISIQTGEEFSLEFLRDRVTPQKGGAFDDMNQHQKKRVGFNLEKHHQLDHNGPINVRRTPSESCLDYCSLGRSQEQEVEKNGYLNQLSRYNVDITTGQKLQIHTDEINYQATASPTTTPVYRSNSPHSYQLSPVHKSGSPHSYLPFCNSSRGNPFSCKLKFLCSFGGRIFPWPNDGKLRYVGGETRIISFRKNVTYNEFISKTSAICNQPHTIKYQLPGEDLDALISVSSDEDLHLMIDEYHELERSSQRLRIFLVPLNEPESPCALEGWTVQQNEVDYRYFFAVNGMSDPIIRKSSSRESLSSPMSQSGGYFDNSPTLQRDSPTSYHPWEIQRGVSQINLNLMLSNINTQNFYPPQITTNSYTQSPFPAPSKVRVDTNSPTEVYEENSPHSIKKTTYEKSYYNDATAYNYNHPLEMAPVVNYHQDMDDDRPIDKLAIYSEKLPAHKNTTALLSESNLLQSRNNTLYFPSDFELKHEENSKCVEEGILSSPYNLFESEKSPSDAVQEPDKTKNPLPMFKTRDVNKAYEWDLDMIKWMEKKDFVVSQEQNVLEGYDSLIVQTYDLEAKSNSGNTQHIPNLRLTVHNSGGESRLPGCTKAPSPATLSYQVISNDIVSHESPEAVKPISQTPFTRVSSTNLDDDPIVTHLPELSPRADPVLAKLPYFYEESAHNSAEKEHHVISKSRNDINTPKFTVVENVTDSMPHNLPPSSAIEPRAQELSDRNILSMKTKNESKGPSSDCTDAKGDDQDESISDVALAEMDASVHGLQIIKNADLEELRELGSGTFGTVYHGKWRGTDVAIKRIRKSCFAGRSSEQEQLTKDFSREAHILSKLHHPNVVAFYGVVPDAPEGTLATVTEFMWNGSLRHVLLRKDRALDRRKRLIILRDAAFGMEYLHLKNIVHFDLKCDNLLVNLGDPQRPICKVGDFGLSRIKRKTLVTGGVRGTLPWMAPELLDDSSSQVSEKVDVYSFGITMWEILTREEPYADMHCGAIIGGIVNNTLRPPIPARCDVEWRKLMEECWSPDAASRPSFTEITKRLQVMLMAIKPKRYNHLNR